MNEDGTGTIFGIHDRKNYISRKAPRLKGGGKLGERLEQIIAANVDRLYIVSSVKHPKFNNKLIDRIIVSAESSGVIPKIIINKLDLDLRNEIEVWKYLYEDIGYEVFPVSAVNETGIDALRNSLNSNVNMFWGQSGVGKSSVLNALFPKLKLKTGDISSYTNKGTHTTVTSLMVNVAADTFIIDNPGVREIDPYGIRKEELGHYFKEFVPFLHNCRFNSCTHTHEPECGVKSAVEEAEISEERYESYINLLESIEDGMNFLI